MKSARSVLRPFKKLRGGIHLDHQKNAENFETVIMPPPEKVFIPMSQHIGAHAAACVKKGDNVYVGTVIGEAAGAVSAPVHSSVSGVVEDIIVRSMGGRDINVAVIASDGEMKPDPGLKKRTVRSAKALTEAATECGLVGLGGAGFPTGVKLSPPKGTVIDTLVINGAECEPYITSDFRELIENAEDVVEGVYLIKKLLKIEKAVIGIESNKPAAIEKIAELVKNHKDADGTVSVMRLPSSYPQGAEKAIIYSATGRKLPGGALPSAVGCIVMNVTSVGTLYRFIKTGMPLVRKRITVDGSAVSEPKNIYVAIGTPIKDVLEFVGGVDETADRIIMGGPMMGAPVLSPESVVEKRNNAILVMKPRKPRKTTNCIRCGRCAAACPMHLYPQKVEAAYNAGLKENLEGLNVNYCMECGSCSYVCPAKRPLTEVMRISKQILRGKK